MTLDQNTSMPALAETLVELPAENERAQGRFYKPELDGLRFYAFVGVFVCHTFPVDQNFYSRLHWPLPWLWSSIFVAGAAGVDLFFALSAFLITSLLLRERSATGRISLRRFYIRRILRIWPLYFLMVALGVIFARVSATRPHLFYYTQNLPWYYVAGYLVFLSNWVTAIWGAVESICAPLWTISIEEQFYLLWPIGAKFLNRRGMLWAGMVTFLCAALSNIVLLLVRGGAGYVYFGSISRCDSLAVGILMALLVDSAPKITRVQRTLLLLAGLTVMIVSTSWINGARPLEASSLLVLGRVGSSLAAGAVLYACLGSKSVLLNGQWVVRLGKISYGLYMLHFTGILLALSILRPTNEWSLSVGKIFGFVLTIGLAAASYRWVEAPFLRLKSRFATVQSRPV